MAKVKLSYNPYTEDINIEFNGKNPRINSQIEKYLEMPMQTWISDVPEIFCNEMNGYDFDIEYSGTALDLQELKDAFRAKGVKETDVRFMVEKALEDREKKTAEIEALLNWFKENPNRNFDEEAFRNENSNLFDTDYPIIVITDESIDVKSMPIHNVKIECISDVSELADIDITNVPIIMTTRFGDTSKLISQINYFKREGIKPYQLFFHNVDGSCEDGIRRFIQDLGIAHPQMIRSIGDELVTRYLYLYSVSDYIRCSLAAFSAAEASVKTKVTYEGRKNEKTNGEINRKISAVEDDLKRIMGVYHSFIECPVYKRSLDEEGINHKAGGRIRNWRKKYIYTTDAKEASQLAGYLSIELRNSYKDALTAILADYTEIRTEMLEKANDWYCTADREYTSQADTAPAAGRFEDSIINEMPFYTNEFPKLKSEVKVARKDNLIDKFRPMANHEKETIQTRYEMAEWRSFAEEKLNEALSAVEAAYADDLSKLWDEQRSQYIKMLEVLISKEQAQKKQLQSLLSEDQKIVQKDEEWLEEFENRIGEIKEA